jgi:hypothetical protein
MFKLLLYATFSINLRGFPKSEKLFHWKPHKHGRSGKLSTGIAFLSVFRKKRRLLLTFNTKFSKHDLFFLTNPSSQFWILVFEVSWLANWSKIGIFRSKIDGQQVFCRKFWVSTIEQQETKKSIEPIYKKIVFII